MMNKRRKKCANFFLEKKRIQTFIKRIARRKRKEEDKWKRKKEKGQMKKGKGRRKERMENA